VTPSGDVGAPLGMSAQTSQTRKCSSDSSRLRRKRLPRVCCYFSPSPGRRRIGLYRMSLKDLNKPVSSRTSWRSPFRVFLNRQRSFLRRLQYPDSAQGDSWVHEGAEHSSPVNRGVCCTFYTFCFQKTDNSGKQKSQQLNNNIGNGGDDTPATADWIFVGWWIRLLVGCDGGGGLGGF
jgi:hypothetical protein